MSTINKEEDPTRALERRIAAALVSSNITSVDLAALVGEVKSAITQADASAVTERARALDPALSPDPTKAREVRQKAEFSAARLRLTLPRLMQRQQDIEQQEYLARWQADFARLKVERDALATALSDNYQQFAVQLAGISCRAKHGAERS